MDFPNIRHMSIFAEAVACGSVSEAAQRVHLTQPAASQGIARLEEALGEPLFLRQGGRVTATPAGEAFAARVTRALALIDRGGDHAGRGQSRRAAGARLAHKLTAAQLRALIAVGDAGSFTLAAQALKVAQPSVHRRARTLEQILDTPLLRNTAAGVTLTSAGLALYQNAKLAREELRQGQEELAALAGRGQGRVALGALPLPRSQLIPQAVDALVRQQDGVQVRIVDGPYAELLRGLREGDIDAMVGALRDPLPAQDVVQEVLTRDDLVIITGRAHPLAGRAEVCLEETEAFPWVAPPQNTPSGSYLFEALQIASKPETPVRVVTSSLVILRGLLRRGPYVSIISRQQVAQEVRAGDIAILPIALPGSARDIGLTTRVGWRPTQAQQRCLEALRAAARSNKNL